jgi:hypothetical protein
MLGCRSCRSGSGGSWPGRGRLEPKLGQGRRRHELRVEVQAGRRAEQTRRVIASEQPRRRAVADRPLESQHARRATVDRGCCLRRRASGGPLVAAWRGAGALVTLTGHPLTLPHGRIACLTHRGRLPLWTTAQNPAPRVAPTPTAAVREPQRVMSPPKFRGLPDSEEGTARAASELAPPTTAAPAQCSLTTAQGGRKVAAIAIVREPDTRLREATVRPAPVLSASQRQPR